jgi:hypothetical protein
MASSNMTSVGGPLKLSPFHIVFIPVYGSCYDIDTRWRLITIYKEFPPSFLLISILQHYSGLSLDARGS